MSLEVRQSSLADITPLRVEVLRQGTPVTHCDYPEDSYTDVVHFTIDDGTGLVATSTWFSKECPGRPGVSAVQLKGMAVRQSLQGHGLGSVLIDAGVDLAINRGAKIVWARARDSALDFYRRCGFDVDGDGFIDEPTAMPHHIVIKNI